MVRNTRLLRWIINGVCLLAAVAVLAVFLLNRVNIRWPALQCRGPELVPEPHLSHKYQGDTVKNWILVTVILLGPVVQILLVELYLNRPIRGYAKSSMLCTAKWFADYMFGLIFAMLVIDIGKSTINAPRPHFLDSCQPTFDDDAGRGCVLGWIDGEEYSCANPYRLSNFDLNDIHKSFPSGHAGIGMYSAVFMILYLHHSLEIKRVGSLTLLLLHTAWFGWGFFCGLSRVMDNRHHPIDVAVGFLIGGTAAVLCVVVVSHRFRDRLNQEPGGRMDHETQTQTMMKEQHYAPTPTPAAAANGNGNWSPLLRIQSQTREPDVDIEMGPEDTELRSHVI